MKHILTTQTWWITHNNGELVAYGSGENDGEVWTSRTNWETYSSETEWRARLLELGVEPQEVEDETE